jgi:hypothetical protein
MKAWAVLVGPMFLGCHQPIESCDAPARSYADVDGDGFGDPATAYFGCTPPDGRRVDSATDCDDARANAYPGSSERCDAVGQDDDCDGHIDEADAADVSTFFRDDDGDGFGGPNMAVACAAPAGFVAAGGDCDDHRADVNPNAPEVCGPGAVDDDCDGDVDTDDADVASVTWVPDRDGDGFGDATADPVTSCSAPEASASDATDCDDLDPGVHPGASETCDGHDEDCDRDVDEGAVIGGIWYEDNDQDGFGAGAPVTPGCTVGAHLVDRAGDCDDAESGVSPSAAEVCGGGDEDCDSLVDSDDPDVIGQFSWYPDSDGDGFGSGPASISSCTSTRPDGAADRAGDCAPNDLTVHPAAAERCNDADDNCNGLVDDADPTPTTGGTTWYADIDGDGHGGSIRTLSRCAAPAGYTATDTDCDDRRRDVSPNGVERCDPLDADEDCDRQADDLDTGLPLAQRLPWYLDDDGDGFGDPAAVTRSCAAPSRHVASDDDCDDDDDTVHPGAEETCAEGDEDCDPFTGPDGVGPPGSEPECPMASCQAIHLADPLAPTGTYWLEPGGVSPIPVWCDMDTDGGGWTLVARIRWSSLDHASTGSVGTLTGPTQEAPAKLDDATINSLRGPGPAGVLRFECGGIRHFFRKDGVAFQADGPRLTESGYVGSALLKCGNTPSGPFTGPDTILSGDHNGLSSYQSSCPYGIYQWADSPGCFTDVGGRVAGLSSDGALWVR